MYVNGAWHDVDTTPSIWAEAEAERASVFEPLMDWLSWLRFRFDQWRASDDSAQSPSLWLALLVALLGYVGWRLRLHKRHRASQTNAAVPEVTRERKGADSDFYRIEEYLLKHSLGRGETEPVTCWLNRLEREGIKPMALAKLNEVVTLHYRYRFDPNCLANDERRQLADSVSEWLRHYASDLAPTAR